MTSRNKTWLRLASVSIAFIAVLALSLGLVSGVLNYTAQGLGDETYQAQFPATHAFFLTVQLMVLIWGTIISVCLAAAAGYLTERAWKNKQ